LALKNSLDTLLPDSRIFVDANIFLYAILGHPALKPRCQKFLMNIENGQYRAMTSSLVLNEVLHKLMLTAKLCISSPFGLLLVATRAMPANPGLG
jgi:predicted nucleic acid-binding protein